MSTLFINTKNFICHGTQYGINCAKNFGLRIIHSKTVQANVEKASFVAGYAFMNLNQRLFGKAKLFLPEVIQKNIVNGAHEHLDWLIGLGSSEMTEKLTSLFLNVIEPIQRGIFTDHLAAEEELVSTYSFPPQILEDRFSDFRHFVLDSKIYLPMNYFKHPIVYSSQHDDILVNLNGNLVPSKTILENFRLENRAVSERMFLPAFIIDKRSEDKYFYLENGLTRHDVEKEIRPYKTLPVQERPKQPIVTFNFCIDSKLESPEDAANFFYHAWCELIQPNGECYSFGLFGKGVAQCPDPSSFRNADIRSIPFEITPDQAIAIFEKVQLLRKEMQWNYHFTKNNCATLVRQIASVIDIHILEHDRVKAIDSPITRIKMYAVSSIFAQLLRHPDIIYKIGMIQELANLKGLIDNLPSTIKELITKFSMEESLETISAMTFFEHHPQVKTILVELFTSLQKGIEELDVNKLADYLHQMTNLIPPKEMQELCRSILQGSLKELTYKIYNLFDSLFTNYCDYEVDSPGFVYEYLREVHAQKTEIPKYEFITII